MKHSSLIGRSAFAVLVFAPSVLALESHTGEARPEGHTAAHHVEGSGDGAEFAHGAHAEKAHPSETGHSEGHGSHHDDAAHDGETAHGSGHGHDHVPTWEDINWAEGMFLESAEHEPSFIYRKPGTQPPLLALILNTAILLFAILYFSRGALKQGLLDRKKRVMTEMDAAAQMRAEAEAQLAHYEGKLKAMEDEMERIMSEMRAQATKDRERILRDAEARRDALVAEARSSMAQELLGLRQELSLAVTEEAVRIAERLITAQLGQADHDRLAQDLISGLGRAGSLGTSGGFS